MTVVERLSYVHASAGWCVIGNNMEGTTLAIYIEDDGIEKVFAGAPTSRSPATACPAVLPGRSTADT